MDLSSYFCPNSRCADHGIRGKGNITTSTRYGKNKTLLLRCKTCNHRFSENHGTAFMHSNYSKQDIQRIILAIAECNSIRGTARILAYDKDAVSAGKYCRDVLQLFTAPSRANTKRTKGYTNKENARHGG